MKRALITGADGFLGSHLTDFLLDKKLEVYGLKRPNSKIKNLSHYTGGKKVFPENEKLPFLDYQIVLPSETEQFTLLECDLNDATLLEQIIKEIKPQFIFHFGAQSYVIPSWEDPRYTVKTNIIGTINVFEPLKKHKINSRVIVACSSAEYGTTTEKINRPLRESDPLRAVHPYGISKIATELLAHQYHLNFGIDIVNLRFFNQTGPRKVNDACSDFVRRIAQIEHGLVEPVIEVGNLSPYRDITGIKDSLQAIWLAAQKGTSGETYNVCSSRKIQIRKILETSLNFSSKEIEVKENVPDKLRKTDEDIILGDNSKLKKELGFKLTQSIDEILKEMFDYWMDFYKK